MSTRANIVVKGSFDETYFYRHSDGYPSGTLPTLTKFMQLVADGKIRNNASQASGWLVIIGHEEYEQYRTSPHSDWKVGAYEPEGERNDQEYTYICNLHDLTIEVIDRYGEKTEVIAINKS